MTSDSYYYLGLTLFELRQCKRSKEILLVALARQQKQKPLKILDIMLTRYQLARCEVRPAICAKAQFEFESVLPFFESRSASGDQTIVHLQYELAFIAYRNKNWKRALDFFQEALLNHETIHVNSSLDVLQCQQYLAAIFRELQRYDEALGLYQLVLEKRKENLQAPHQTLVDVQTVLCETLCWLGKFAEASPLIQEALKWQEQLSSTEHPSCLPIRLMHAKLAYDQLDFYLAAELYSKALAQLESSDQARKAVYNPLASSYATLALALSKLGRTNEAKQQAAKALKHDYSEGHQYCQGLDGLWTPLVNSCCKRRPRIANNRRLPRTRSQPLRSSSIHAQIANRRSRWQLTKGLQKRNHGYLSSKKNGQIPVSETRQTPSPVTSDTKRPPPPPKRKPAHLQQKFTGSSGPKLQASGTASTLGD